MSSYVFLKKTIISKKSLLLYLAILFEILMILKYKNSSRSYNFICFYENIIELFKFSVIIIQYLFFISMYFINYKRDYIILRYTNISSLKKLTLKDTAVMTGFFVILFNAVTFILVNVMFGPEFSSESAQYMLLTLLCQLISFSILGYIYMTSFFKNNSITKSIFITLVVYFIVILFFESGFSLFVIPSDITTDEIVSIFKMLVSAVIISIIFSIYNKDKAVEFYDKKR